MLVWMKRSLLGLADLLVAIQFIPYGRDHTNPPVMAEPAWDSNQTRELSVKACFDCHSNEVIWPWYSKIAPISWLVQKDVDEGREELNFSEWNRPQEGDEASETVTDGSMPPWQYLLTHSEARLSEPDLNALSRGLASTLGNEDGENHDSNEDDDDLQQLSHSTLETPQEPPIRARYVRPVVGWGIWAGGPLWLCVGC